MKGALSCENSSIVNLDGKDRKKNPKRNRNSLIQRSSAAAGLIGQGTVGTEMGNNLGVRTSCQGKIDKVRKQNGRNFHWSKRGGQGV